MQPLLNRRINVSQLFIYFFTSPHLAKELKKKRTSLIESESTARREIPRSLMFLKNKLHETKILKHEETGTTLTGYQGKLKKNVIILSTLHLLILKIMK